jgi:hypothetical protein
MIEWSRTHAELPDSEPWSFEAEVGHLLLTVEQGEDFRSWHWSIGVVGGDGRRDRAGRLRKRVLREAGGEEQGQVAHLRDRASAAREDAEEASMKERPILFSAPMVRALLAGTKTQTRRIVKWKPRESGLNLGFSGLSAALYNTANQASGWVLRSRVRWRMLERSNVSAAHCPYGTPGDRLWVRETHARFHIGEGMDRPVPECVAYRATCAT